MELKICIVDNERKEELKSFSCVYANGLELAETWISMKGYKVVSRSVDDKGNIIITVTELRR